ncbi:MAG: FkbM family methyltransferase [bacterium]|nr:FkbM family methyltransferase [bacterium]
MDTAYNRLLANAYRISPLTLVDCGAAGGIHKRWEIVEAHLRVVGFEPDSRSLESMQTLSSRHVYLPIGLHNKADTLEFYQAKTKTDSSLLRPRMPFLKKFPKADRFETVSTAAMQVDRLDAVLARAGIDDVDFIKIDTQGSELYILQGALESLKVAAGVEVEVEFSVLYENQPLFADVDSLLRSQGFQLFDLAPIYWKRKLGKNIGRSKGQIIYADALYLKDSETLARAFEREDLKKAKLLKEIFIATLYGYFDFALEIAEVAAHTMTPEEYRTLVEGIRAKGKISSRVPYFWGKKSIAAVCRKIARAIDPDPEIWQLADSILGNVEER